MRDFPGGPVVKNPPSNAGNGGSIPDWGTKIPHASGQLSLCAAATESVRSGACVPQLLSLRAATTEPAPQLERSPCAAAKDPTGRNKDPECRN